MNYSSSSSAQLGFGLSPRRSTLIRTAAWVLGVAGLMSFSSVKATNTEADFGYSFTDLTTGADYNAAIPNTASASAYDVVFGTWAGANQGSGTYTSTAFTDGTSSAGTLVFGSLNDFSTQAITITAGVTGSTLTLGTTTNGVGNASDAIYVANGANLTLGTTANSFLSVAVGTTGDNLDVVGTGTLTLDATLNYGAININKTGTGTLVLGTNGKLTSTSGSNTFTLSAGTLILGSTSAFTVGNLVIKGGTLDDSLNLSTVGNLEQIDIGGTSASTGSVSFTLGNSHQLTLAGQHTPSTVFLDKTTTITLAGANNNSNTVMSTTENDFTTGTAGAGTIEVDEAAGTTGATLTMGTFKLQAAAAAGTNTNINEIFQGNGNILINGAVTDGTATNGTRGITYAGTGTLTLSSALNTYDGGMDITGGTVSISADGSLGAVPGSATVGNVIIDNTAGNGATLATTANITISSNRGISLGSSTASTGGTLAPATGTTLTYGGILANNGVTNSLTVNGLGTVDLTGANTYSGVTTVSAGTLEFGNEGALYGGTTTNWTASNLVVASGGTLAFAVGASPQFTNSDITTLLANLDGVVSNNGLEAGSVLGFDTTAGNFTIGNNIADTTGTGGGSVGLTKLGINTLTLGGSNTYTGLTTINGGVLSLASSGALGGGGNITFTGGTLQYSASNMADDSALIVNSTGAISIDTNGQSITFGSALASSNTGGLTKLGAGTLTLTTAESYTGTTTVNNGTLALNLSTGTATATALSLGGGTLSDTGSSTTAQAFASTAVASGASTVSNSSSHVLKLAAITRTAGAVVNFTPSSSTAGNAGSITTTNANAGTSGILGGWATYNGSDWATDTGSTPFTLAAYAGYTTLTSTGGGTQASTNFSYTASGSTTLTLSANITANSLKINDASSSDSLSTNTHNITFNGISGGLLYTGGGTYNINGTGVVGSGTTSEFIVQVNTGSTLDINAPVVSGTATAGSLTKGGAGTLVLGAANVYTGATTVDSGILYAGNSSGSAYSAPSSDPRTISVSGTPGSATGTGAVTVKNGATLAGGGTIAGAVTVQTGGTLFSGGTQTASGKTSTITGTGLTLNNAAALSSILSVNAGSTLSFALGAGASTGTLAYSTPNQNSTYLNIAGNGAAEVNFATSGSAINIDLVDLTATAGATGLHLYSVQNPYLLIQAGSDNDYNLETTNGYDVNGYVTGTSSNGGTSVDTSIFNLEVTALGSSTPLSLAPYGTLDLYLYNGDLEVVPEPSTWAMMIGGLALLVLLQRRRKSSNWGPTRNR